MILEIERKSHPEREGEIEVPGGKVWFRELGRSHTATPLLVLHGGPGYPSDELEPLEQLASERPVVFYDQLGSGRSDKPHDASLWKITRFVEELGIVREKLGLTDVHIFGHSWGAMLATEYILTKEPKGVKSLVLAGPLMSVKMFEQDVAKLKKEIPLEVQEQLAYYEATGDTENEEYLALSGEFDRRFVFRLDPLPQALERANQGEGREVYETMWGTAEMLPTGNLKSFERFDDLNHLTVPVLYTCGRYDEMTPETVGEYHKRTPNSKIRIFENSAHFPHFNEQDAYIATVRDYLKEIDSP